MIVDLISHMIGELRGPPSHQAECSLCGSYYCVNKPVTRATENAKSRLGKPGIGIPRCSLQKNGWAVLVNQRGASGSIPESIPCVHFYVT